MSCGKLGAATRRNCQRFDFRKDGTMSMDVEAESATDVVKKTFETEVYDVMEGASRGEIKVHDHGMVALLDVMPRFAPVGKSADYAIVQAARVSYGEGTKQINE